MDLSARATAGGVGANAARVTTRRPRSRRGSFARRVVRRVVRRVYVRLPGRLQRLALRLGAAKVSLGVCAVVRDTQGRILLAHHTYRRRAWGLPGGLVGRGEPPATALVRELREELGVSSAVGPLLAAESATASRHLTLYYAVTLLGTPAPDGVEIDAVRYVAPEAVPTLLGERAHLWLASLWEPPAA